MALILRNGSLIDGSGTVMPDEVVVIDGSIIQAAGRFTEVWIPPGRNEVIDVGGMMVMPAMMDLHKSSMGGLQRTVRRRRHAA